MKKSVLVLSALFLLSGCAGLNEKHKHAQMSAQAQKGQKHLIYHVNPMPNFMQVVMKYDQQLQLTTQQISALAEWRANHNPVMAELKNAVVEEEQDLRSMALINVPESELLEQYEQIEKLRGQIATTKIECRSNMQKILSEQQFSKLQELYRVNLLSRHL